MAVLHIVDIFAKDINEHGFKCCVSDKHLPDKRRHDETKNYKVQHMEFFNVTLIQKEKICLQWTFYKVAGFLSREC